MKEQKRFYSCHCLAHCYFAPYCWVLSFAETHEKYRLKWLKHKALTLFLLQNTLFVIFFSVSMLLCFYLVYVCVCAFLISVNLYIVELRVPYSLYIITHDELIKIRFQRADFWNNNPSLRTEFNRLLFGFRLKFADGHRITVNAVILSIYPMPQHIPVIAIAIMSICPAYNHSLGCVKLK